MDTKQYAHPKTFAGRNSIESEIEEHSLAIIINTDHGCTIKRMSRRAVIVNVLFMRLILFLDLCSGSQDLRVVNETHNTDKN